MKAKKLRKLYNARLRWEDKRKQRPYLNHGQFMGDPSVAINFFIPLRIF